MVYNHKAQCGSKQLVLVDSFESDDIAVSVYVFNSKWSVKRYCRDTGLEFREGMRNAYGR
jgi:hypothetical protein